MKAAFIEKFGDPEVLKYGDLPDPVAAPGEVVIDVIAASVNGADWTVRSGQYSQAAFPLVFGRDFSGVVAAAGLGVDDLKVGDAVFGVLEAGREGAYVEKLTIKAAIVAKKPDGLSHVNAAAVALYRAHRDQRHRDDLAAQARRDHPHSGRRRRGRELHHSACQAYWRPCDHHYKRGEPELCAPPRRQ